MRLLLRGILPATAICAGACRPAVVISSGAADRDPTTGGEVLTAMYRRYDGRWYRTLTFVQTSTYYRADGSVLRRETWYEAAQLPGRLRIDLGELSRGNGVLYRADSTYQIQDGRVTQRTAGRNLLLTLGFDVYAQAANRTRQQLQAEGMDLSRLRVDTLDGRRVWVVGAASGDETTNQFWVDAERLLFVRLVQTQQGRTRDIRFERYTRYEGGWVAEVVRVLSGGRMTFHEQYSQVRVNESLDEDLFIPERWSSAAHWYRP